MISCFVVFDGRVTSDVCDDTHQGLLGSCVKFSQTVVAGSVEKSISKLRNSHKSGKIDLSCIEMELDYIQGCHTILISKICPNFAVLHLRKYYYPFSLFLSFILISDLDPYYL